MIRCLKACVLPLACGSLLSTACEERKPAPPAVSGNGAPTAAPAGGSVGGAPPVSQGANLTDADVVGAWSFDAAAALEVAKDQVRANAKRDHLTLSAADVSAQAADRLAAAKFEGATLTITGDALCTLASAGDSEGGKWVLNGPSLDVAIARFGQMRFTVSGGVMKLTVDEASDHPPMAFKKR